MSSLRRLKDPSIVGARNLTWKYCQDFQQLEHCQDYQSPQ